MRLPARLQSFLQKALTPAAPLYQVVSWWPRILESFLGAWQQNIVVDEAAVAANWAVFSCVTLIAGDIAKMPARVMQFDQAKKVWLPSLVRPVLRKPNRYQTWPDFIRSWLFSLLLNGNTYVLKRRDPKTKFVVELYVLDPNTVRVLATPIGEIYYAISPDNTIGVTESMPAAPATEVIHDRINTLYHPLIGLSPIFAHGVAAMQGLAIQQNSAKFFQNMSRPSGMLTAPGPIDKETAARLKATFQTNFSEGNLGKLFVAGDGLKYEPMTISAEDSQMIEQLKFTGEMICATMHVPPYKLGLGPMPTVNNTAALNQQYYDQCLHPLVDGIERRLDDGLELEYPFETWFDTSELLRMDPSTRYAAHGNAIGAGWLAINEARREENREPLEGGDTPYLQQQLWPLAQLAKRPPPEEAPVGPTMVKPEPAQKQLSDEDARRALRVRLLTRTAA